MKAYVLIEIGAGKVNSVVKELRRMQEVQVADSLTGMYDAIAIIETADPEAIRNVVTEKLHTMDGITRTLTCFAVEIP
ncbi:MAG: Lrp/AsnC ligand binding domain-containing protein [Gemmatimonadota bacterium]|nr:MAG: Lrp/AsnC ligand binding domain-containing protein [Gemmatimonadota bacterium]